MVKARHDKSTLDLLTWAPPAIAVRFEEDEIRGATLYAKLCRAMALALKECGKDRDQVAKGMSDYLGEPVSKPMLDAYLSEARDTHTINIIRFAALIHVTGDYRLLSILPELFGFAVMEERYASLVRAQQLREKAAEMIQAAEIDERRAKGMRS